MLSRVADSIYWLNRYIERIENIARFIDVNFNLSLEFAAPEHVQWQPLVSTTGDSEYFNKTFKTSSKENVVRFLTFDKEYPNSIINCLTAARENARSIREVISSEMWEQVNKLYIHVRDSAKSQLDIDQLYDFYTQVKLSSHLFTGIMDSTMSHNEGWHFGRMGRLLERADKTSRIIDVKYFFLLPQVVDVGTPIDNVQWAALLKSASGLEMYRKVFGRIHPSNVASFLVLNRDFPRSLHYCLIRSEESLHVITGSPLGTFQNPAEQALGRLRSELDFISIGEIIHTGMHQYLDQFQLKLNHVGDSIFETFFAVTPVAVPE